MEIELQLIRVNLSIAKVPESIDPNRLLENAEFISFTKTNEEISLVVDSEKLPTNEFVSKGWRALKIIGPLDFSLVGVLQKVIDPLAHNDISVFIISTFDTDYILVRQEQLEKAIKLLAEQFKITRD